MKTVLFAAIIIQWITSRDNAATQSNTDRERTAAGERSIVTRHSNNRSDPETITNAQRKSLDRIMNGGNSKGNPNRVDEEIDLTDFSARIGNDYNSTDELKDDSESERSMESLAPHGFGNRTRVSVGRAKRTR